MADYEEYEVTVTKKSGCLESVLGGLVLLAIIIAAITGSCGKDDSAEYYDDSESLYEEDYYDNDYDNNYVEDEYDNDSSSQGSTYNGGTESDVSANYTPVKPKAPSLEELCFYSGNSFLCLNHCSSAEDIFGGTHYGVIYNRFGYMYDDPNDYCYFTNKYYLAGEYSSLSFNTFTQSGCTDKYSSIYVYVSYGGPDEETLVYSDDFYGGLPPKPVSLDLSGVTYLYITITPDNCGFGYNDCHLCAGDFVLE